MWQHTNCYNAITKHYTFQALFSAGMFMPNLRKYLYLEHSSTSAPFPQKLLIEVSFCNFENTTEASQARYGPD